MTDTSFNLKVNNPLVPNGVTATETDTGFTKTGNGKVRYNSLPYDADPGSSGIKTFATDELMLAASGLLVGTIVQSSESGMYTVREQGSLIGDGVNSIIGDNFDFELYSKGVKPYVDGGYYLNGEQVYYEHITGNLFPITKGYYLRAKGNFTSSSFDIFDWEIVTPNSYVLDRVQIQKNGYEILPGDTVSVPSERYTLYNNRKGIAKVEDLLSEYLLSDTTPLNYNYKSHVIKDGFSVSNFDWEISLDTETFGMKHLFTSNVFSIYIDKFPESFEWWGRIKFKGDVSVRTSYPKIPTIYYSLAFYPHEDAIDILRESDFSAFVSSTYYRLDFNTVDDEDLFFFKFYRSRGEEKVSFKKYDLNYQPENILI